jgi:hypothetical protein
MTRKTTTVFSLAIIAMLLVSPVVLSSKSATSVMAFATDNTSYNQTSDEIYVNGTSHDGTVVVHLASVHPKAGESLPLEIYFTDSNETAIRHVHYSLAITQDGNQVSSLPHVFLNQGMLEHHTPPLGSANQVDVQVTILGIGLPYDKDHWTGPIGDVVDLKIGTIPPSLNVSADQTSYKHGDTATIKAEFHGYGQGQNIAIIVKNPTGDVIISRSVLTDDSGTSQVSFKIPDSYQVGTYDVTASADAGGMTYNDTTQFSIEGESPHFRIISVEATDQNGNPVTSFSRGYNGFVKMVVSADSNQTALITADVFDSNSVSLGVGSVKTNLGAGESQMVVSVYIPKDAVVGTANLFANAFSDWPSNGGIPLTPEVSSTVEVK